MMIKVNDRYLEFSGEVEVDKQIKLFETIDEANGDFSYSFDLDMTTPNMEALGLPYPDNQSKTVYSTNRAELQSDAGETLHVGSLRVEVIRYEERKIQCSFFAGNSNWFGQLSGPLSDIDFSDLDVNQTPGNIQASWSNTEGVVFPVVDNGILFRRGVNHMKSEDFVAGMYVKTIVNRIFQKHSIKIQGDLLNEPLYNQITIQKNGKSQDQINENSSYVEKLSTTARPVELDFYKMTFQNDTVYPYYDGAADSFDLANSRYVAPFKMLVRVEASFTPSIVDSSYNQRIYLYINGVFTFVDVGLSVGGLYNSATPGDQDTFTIDRTIVLETGDILEVYTQWQQSVGSTQNDVLSGWVKITPIYIYRAFGNAAVPSWTQQEFISNIFSIFNVLPSYDQYTKTLTLDLFEKIKGKSPIDLSEFVTVNETDYSEFISNFGKRNLLSYQQVDLEDIRQYNIQNFFKYAQGSVNADNDFLEDSVSLVESDFANPESYINPAFDMSMERLNLITVEEGDTVDFTVVTSSLGQAVFTIDRDIFLLGDLVRITESEDPKYNGDWIVDFISAGSIECFGLNFSSDCTGKITKLNHRYNETEDVYLLVNVPDYQVQNFSGLGEIRVDTTNFSRVGTAFFALLQMGRPINTAFKQSLSFGNISSPLFYQRTIVQTYWSLFERMVNDPVKLRATGNLPLKTYRDIDFLRPVMIKTLETVNLYYVNLLRGYKGSHLPCDLELIKLP